MVHRLGRRADAAVHPDGATIPKPLPAVPGAGLGLIVAVIALTLLGSTTANLVGRTLIAYGEMLLDRMPMVRPIYRGLKQIFETVLSKTSQSSSDVGLIEYPRPGMWSIVFVATEPRGELPRKAAGEEDHRQRLPADHAEPDLCGFLPVRPARGHDRSST
ncbi:MAG: DUF502 domain-containing protein [Pseudorhodoplanes sp.]|nr:DUF502 domain-containing protein [Pseudorhodoplanes sp.]